MNAQTKPPLTDQELREARRAWQRLSPDERNAIRKLVMYLDGSQVKDIRENPLSEALTKGGKP